MIGGKIVSTVTGKNAILIEISNENGTNQEIIESEQVDEFIGHLVAIQTIMDTADILMCYLMNQMEYPIERAAHETRVMLGMEVDKLKEGRE